MKKYLTTALSILIPLSVVSSAQADSLPLTHPELNPEESQLIAQFGRIRIPGGSSSEEAEEAQEESASASFAGFSGEYGEYLDDYNGFSVDIPVEFELSSPGQTTNWIGPILDEGAVGIYVNAAPLPGVSAATLQETYRQQYEADRFYTDVQTLSVPYRGCVTPSNEVCMVPALRVREVDNQQGTRTQKNPDDIHRWHLFVFGNERVYTWGFTGMFQTFQDEEVQATYEEVISSVELVSIVE
ncbi:MAG: hypothetical protein VKL39_19185 [Leptolyngbyaceae bacterium]|nr:hypothetical protein [Leptolyngbyaceae bacterium]